MKWLFPVILIGISLVGCKSSTPVCDPFFGRTTIPPPPTGSVSGQTSDPGYQPPPLTPPPAAAPTYSTPAPMQPANPSPLSNGAPALPGPSPAAPNTWNPTPAATAPINPVAPRPTPTLPPQPPATGSPYLPPGGSFNNGGASTRGVAPSPSAPTAVQPAPVSYTNVSATRATAVENDRMPRPIDDATAPGSLAGQKPIIRTLQPQGGSRNASAGAIDISQLPSTP